MTAEEIYTAWAPEWSRWSAWAKPVVFAHMHDAPVFDHPGLAGFAALLPDTRWVPPADGRTALVVDLPDAQSTLYGLALAEHAGYRPVPLYNSAPAAAARFGLGGAGAGQVVVDMADIVAALRQGAGTLAQLRLSPDAPPAFLLDARRRVGSGKSALRPSAFDNRSISLPTDFPSANLLQSTGVQQVVVVQQVGDQPQTDLAHTLRRWQEAGIRMFVHAPDAAAEPMRSIVIRRPPMFRHLWYGLLARMGLRRNPLGGYGGFIPEPSQSGGRYGSFG